MLAVLRIGSRRISGACRGERLDHNFDLQIAALYWHSSFCSSSTAPIGPAIAASLGKMPTTSPRRLTSLWSRLYDGSVAKPVPKARRIAALSLHYCGDELGGSGANR
jgi:hypothetical protein